MLNFRAWCCWSVRCFSLPFLSGTVEVESDEVGLEYVRLAGLFGKR